MYDVAVGRYIPNDTWAKKAKESQYKARSVFKLEELDRRFRLLKPSQNVLDIGAAPGSWLQYAAAKVGPKGHITGLDRTPIDRIAPNVQTAVTDLLDAPATDQVLLALKVGTVDLVLSDAAPNTSGIKDVDQWRSVELCREVLRLARLHLKTGGTCVMKVLRGADYDELLADVRTSFHTVKTVLVQATREGSREVFMVALKKKGS